MYPAERECAVVESDEAGVCNRIAPARNAVDKAGRCSGQVGAKSAEPAWVALPRACIDGTT